MDMLKYDLFCSVIIHSAITLFIRNIVITWNLIIRLIVTNAEKCSVLESSKMYYKIINKF